MVEEPRDETLGRRDRAILERRDGGIPATVVAARLHLSIDCVSDRLVLLRRHFDVRSTTVLLSTVRDHAVI